MALLHAFSQFRREVVSAVATFDHGTGAGATAAAELVVAECLLLGIPVVAARASDPPETARPSEAVLRKARWDFLRTVAYERHAIIATAHTWDDQAETVAMRILRGASARGLAAMAVPTVGIARPFLSVRRHDVMRFVRTERVPFAVDPSNVDRKYLRNRLRADLLPAVEMEHPDFTKELVAIGEQAAAWRASLRSLVDMLGVQRVDGGVVVSAEALTAFDVESLAIVWPEIASRAGVTLDRRGVERLSLWARSARPGQHIPLSAGGRVERTPRTFVIRGNLGLAPLLY